MKKAKVIVALGSPRKKGNTALLAAKLMEGVQSRGGECELLYLHGMNIAPCTACDRCQDSMDSYCVIRDDMEPLYKKIVRAGAMVIASPIYWFSVSAQTKLFMDRLYAFLGPGGNRLTGMAMGVLLAYGDTDPVNSGAINAIRTFQDAFAYIGAPLVGMVYGSAMDKGDIEKSPEVLAAARELGAKLVSATE
jgi:multimeric flavodoxin WrbA